jgi:hypothetical protein
LLGACVAIAACSTRREPLYAAPGLATRGLRVVAVAPLAEERAFPETQVPLATYVGHAADQVLRAKGYEPLLVGSPPVVNLNAPVLDAAAQDLPALAERYGLWIAVELTDTDSSGVGLDTRVRLAGVLVDSGSGEILWRDRAERESSISGAGFAAISPSVRTYQAVSLAVGTLLETLPDRTTRRF